MSVEWHLYPLAINTMLTPPAEPTRSPSRHSLPRLFIGPLPERLLLNAQRSVAKHVKGPRRLFAFNQSRPSPSDSDEPIEELINHYAYAFHLKLGGSEGDWNEEQENRVKYEMSRRWRESPWGRLWRGRKDSPNARWVLPNDAGSFQVGDFLGLDMYAAEPASRSPRLAAVPIGGSPTEEGPSTSRRTPFDAPSTTAGDTFVTARSHTSPEPEPGVLPQSLENSPVSSNDVPADNSTTSLIRAVPDADRRPGRYRTHTGPTDGVSGLKPALKARALSSAKSDGAVNGPTDTPRSSVRGKGKEKKVVVCLPHDPSPPAPPGEVLQRSGGEMQGTSAAAAEELQAATTSSAPSLDVPDEYDDAKMRGEDIFLCYLVGRVSHPCGVPNSAILCRCGQTGW
jgi:hypothetical protein